jgi:hypothetical protein
MNCNLPYRNQPQLQDQWCWAAVACNVDFFFDPTSVRTQCSIANTVLGENNCCPNSKACNEPARLDIALAEIGRLRQLLSGGASFATCENEICNFGIPICVRVQWSDNTGATVGHFVAVSGIDDTTDEIVTVQDPWFGTSLVPHSELLNDYQGTGNWTHTYLLSFISDDLQ